MGKRKQTIKVVFKQITSVHNWIAVLWQTPEASVEHILELHSHSHCLQVLLGSVHSQPLSAYSTESKPLDKDMKMEVQPNPISWGTNTICYKVITNKTTFTMITIVQKKIFQSSSAAITRITSMSKETSSKIPDVHWTLYSNSNQMQLHGYYLSTNMYYPPKELQKSETKIKIKSSFSRKL